MNQILAALIFFTRLPFWKIKEVPQECFKHVVNYWSFSGWLTGEGWQLWIDQLTGLTNLTVDKVTARQSLVALQLHQLLSHFPPALAGP